MKQEWKQPWITALRSGQYKQTTGTLVEPCDGGFRYCCLGVLQDVCQKAGLQIREDTGEFILDRDEANEILELSKDYQDCLARMNDDGKTFDEIADFIDTEL